MNTFVTLNYYPYFSRNNTTMCYGNADYLTPSKITLNIDSIMSLDSEPHTLKVYSSYEARSTSTYAHMNAYKLKTNIGVASSVNGVDFKIYFITEASYCRLMHVLDPIQCA